MNSLNHDTLMQDTPEELKWLLDGVIKSKNPRNETMKRRKCAISHTIISSCWPRSFLSPLMLSLAMYIHKRHESRELIDMLSSLGFSESYEEVNRLIKCILSTPSYYNRTSAVSPSTFIQFVFDNAD